MIFEETDGFQYNGFCIPINVTFSVVPALQHNVHFVSVAEHHSCIINSMLVGSVEFEEIVHLFTVDVPIKHSIPIVAEY